MLVPKKNTQATGLGRKSCRKGGSRIWSKGPLMGQARAFQNMVFSIIIFNLVKMNRNKDMVKWRIRSHNIVQKYLLKVINWIKHV